MWHTIGRIYDDVETGLWACLVAALIFFLVLFAPHASELRAAAAAAHAQAISAQNRDICVHLGKTPGTHDHVTCLLEMQDFRARIEQQIVADALF